MADLFSSQREANRRAAEPLAARMRPATLAEFAGQSHFMGPGKLLRRMLAADRLTSMIFYGPPGTGKTTLARLIAQETRSHFVEANAASIGVKELREILAAARERLEGDGRRTVLFLDEIHRFNKSQQDVLLTDVEEGVVLLVGATTENPFFTVNSALVSRSQIFQFEPLTETELRQLLARALCDRERGLGAYEVQVSEEAMAFFARTCDGDARRAITGLEVAVLSQQQAAGPSARAAPPRVSSEGQRAQLIVDFAVARESVQRKAMAYDRVGDAHYDSISAFIKSMRGSDPDAATYWLARMLEGGEDPRFVARRVVIAASEDVGNADPLALVVAQAAAQATLMVGMPECRLILAQAVIYLACAPKSNACALAIWEASKDVRENRILPVPRALQSANYAGAKRLGKGEGYRYPHDDKEGIVEQDYLGVDKLYYHPTNRGREKALKEAVEAMRARVRGQGPDIDRGDRAAPDE